MKKISGIILGFLLLPSLVGAQQFPLPSTHSTTEWSFDRTTQSTYAPVDHTVDSVNEAGEQLEDRDETNLKIFRVTKNKLFLKSLPFKEKDSLEQKVWDLFVKIAGTQNASKYVSKFATYDDPNDSTLGFVVKIMPKNPAWGLAINISTFDPNDKRATRDTIVTLIHEYGHLLTLNDKQINYVPRSQPVCNKAKATKGTYFFDRKACSKPDSYINKFVGLFWPSEQLSKIENARFTFEVAQFYDQHPTDFVTPYSVTSTREDIAETFTDFVLRSKPAIVSKKDLKIWFFYGYPEFVKMRSEIRSRIGEYFI